MHPHIDNSEEGKALRHLTRELHIAYSLLAEYQERMPWAVAAAFLVGAVIGYVVGL